MKLLVISAGLVPKHGGGLPAYVGEMIDGLIRNGHQVVYLDPYNSSDSPKVIVEKLGGTPTAYRLYNTGMFEDFNNGSRDPLRQTRASRGTRAALFSVLREERPEIIHVHELIGFPASLLRELRQFGVPIIFTAHDYYSLCPTIKLFRWDGRVCDLPSDQLDCDRCCTAQRYWTHRLHELMPGIYRRGRIASVLDQVVDSVTPESSRSDYVRRRKEMVDALNSLDQVLCISELQIKIFTAAGVRPDRLRLMTLSRQTFRTSPPTQRRQVRSGPLVIAASNILSVEKGRALLQREFDLLRLRHVPVELLVYGEPWPETTNPLISFRGPYTGTQLDDIFANVDFGLIPSVWWEAYGYIGGEMLTRGIPVLACRVGAMSEYVHHEENGLIFGPELGSLAAAVERLVTDPDLVKKLINGAAVSYQKFQPFERHILDLESYYSELLAAHCEATPAA